MPSWLYETIKSLIKNGFYGEVVICFQNGHVQLIKKTETVKPPTASKQEALV